MNRNLLRHRLLEILSKQYVFAEHNDKPSGLTFVTMLKELKCDETELRIAISELFENKEIFIYYIDSEGLRTSEAGLAAFSNKKYLKIYWTNIKDSIKYWFQTLVPVLSLLVALYAVTHDFKEHNKETSIQLREMKSQIELLQLQIEQLKTESKISHRIDSLTIE